MSDYRLRITIKNARILRAIETEGYKSQAEFCRAWGLKVTEVNSMVAIRLSPVNREGRLRTAAQRLCDALCALPEDLWTEDQLYTTLPRCSYERDVSTDDIAIAIEQMDAKKTLALLGDKLTDRERKVIDMRYSQNKTYGEIGDKYDVTRERIRQVENNALRKMRPTDE